MRLWKGGIVAALWLALFVACGDDDSSGGELNSPAAEKRIVSGFVQKGPFSKGSSVLIQELGEESLEPTGKSAEGKVSNDNGAYSVEFEEFESPYVLIKAEGTFHNELTGKVTKSPVTLYALADISDKEKVNVNLLTHLSYKRVLYLVSALGIDVEDAKEMAESEVLRAFGISGNYSAAESLSVSGSHSGDEVLLAISGLMLECLDRDGSIAISINGQTNDDGDMLNGCMADFIADIEKDGVWDDRFAAVRIADWIAGRSMGKKLDSTFRNAKEKMDKFWWKLYELDDCDSGNEGSEHQDKNPLSTRYMSYFRCEDGNWYAVDTLEQDSLKKDTLKNDSLKNDTLEQADTGSVADTNTSPIDTLIFPADTGNVDKDSNAIVWTISEECTEARLNWTIRVLKGDSSRYFTCGEKGWIIMTVEEYEEYRWTVGTEGQSQIKTATQECYVYENGEWNKRDSSNCKLGLRGCIWDRQGELAKSPNTGLWYTCNNLVWKWTDNAKADTILLGHDYEEGAFAKGPASGTSYVYQNGKWRQGTKMDSIMVALGGTTCITEGDTSTVKYNGEYYVCTRRSTSSIPLQWIVAPLIYNDTYDDRAECSETGLYGDGSFHNKHDDPARTYLCDNGTFRLQYSREMDLHAGCVSYNRGKKIKVNYSHFVCTEDGWKVDPTQIEYGTFTDKRDNKEYKTVGIWNQVWMAENLDYRDSVKTPGLEGNRWCYDDDEDFCETYGSIYSCEISKEICPQGWHLPTKAEWDTLFNFVTYMDESFGEALRATSGWTAANGNDANGTDLFGLAVLPGGYRYDDGAYRIAGQEARLWLDDVCQEEFSTIRLSYDNRAGIMYAYGTSFDFYVRCVQDAAE